MPRSVRPVRSRIAPPRVARGRRSRRRRRACRSASPMQPDVRARRRGISARGRRSARPASASRVRTRRRGRGSRRRGRASSAARRTRSVAVRRSGTSDRRRRSGRRLAGPRRERGEAVDEPRQRLAVEAPRIVEQSPARFAHVAGAPRNAREPGHERRLPRIGQHDRARVALAADSVARERAALRPGRARRGRSVDSTMRRDAAHARVDRRAPRRAPARRRAAVAIARRATARSAARTGWRRRPRTARRSGCGRATAMSSARDVAWPIRGRRGAGDRATDQWPPPLSGPPASR